MHDSHVRKARLVQGDSQTPNSSEPIAFYDEDGRAISPSEIANGVLSPIHLEKSDLWEEVSIFGPISKEIDTDLIQAPAAPCGFVIGEYTYFQSGNYQTIVRCLTNDPESIEIFGNIEIAVYNIIYVPEIDVDHLYLICNNPGVLSLYKIDVPNGDSLEFISEFMSDGDVGGAYFSIGDNAFFFNVNYGIGRVNLDGTDLNKEFVSSDDLSGSTPMGVFCGSSKVFWVDSSSPYHVQCCALDGSNINLDFMNPQGDLGQQPNSVFEVGEKIVCCTNNQNMVFADLDGSNMHMAGAVISYPFIYKDKLYGYGNGDNASDYPLFVVDPIDEISRQVFHSSEFGSPPWSDSSPVYAIGEENLVIAGAFYTGKLAVSELSNISMLHVPDGETVEAGTLVLPRQLYYFFGVCKNAGLSSADVSIHAVTDHEPGVDQLMASSYNNTPLSDLLSYFNSQANPSPGYAAVLVSAYASDYNESMYLWIDNMVTVIFNITNEGGGDSFVEVFDIIAEPKALL